MHSCSRSPDAAYTSRVYAENGAKIKGQLSDEKKGEFSEFMTICPTQKERWT